MKKWQKVFATIGLSVLLASGALVASIDEADAFIGGNRRTGGGITVLNNSFQGWTSAQAQCHHGATAGVQMTVAQPSFGIQGTTPLHTAFAHGEWGSVTVRTGWNGGDPLGFAWLVQSFGVVGQ